MRYKTSYDFNEKSMESYFMTDEYVERRRAYVNEIRRSFDRPEVENGTAEEELFKIIAILKHSGKL